MREREMRKHSLKTAVPYFDAIVRGEKKFEVRRDDRGFQAGDKLLLRKYGKGPHSVSSIGYLDAKGEVTGIAEHADTVEVKILWILTGGQFGVEPGYVVMSIDVI